MPKVFHGGLYFVEQTAFINMKTKRNERDFPLSLKLMDTDEVFTLKGMRANTSVKELKSYCDLK